MGGGILGEVLTSKGGDYLENTKLKAKDAESIGKKLIDQAKKGNGPKIIDDPSFQNSAYVGTKSGKRIRNGIAFLKKKARKYGNKDYEKIADKLEGGLKMATGDQVFKHLGKDAVVLGKFRDADVLSHELGHANYLRPGRSKSIIGKAAHKGYQASGIASLNPIGKLGIAANGFHSGMKSAKLKSEGKKESTWNKVKASAALGVAGTAALTYGGKKLYDKHKKNKETTDQDSKATKELSETKEKVRKGLEYTSTGLGLGTDIGLGTAGYYGLKATKKGLDSISAYEGKTVKGLLKNKEVKEAADLIKRGFKNGDVRLKGNGKKALNTAAGLAAASIVAGGASKLLGKNKDSKK